MTRAFRDDPLDPAVVDGLLDLARRGPSAGNTGGPEFLVLEGRVQTSTYWDVTLPPSRRHSFPWPGLLRAPVLIVPWVDPAAYVARYAEPDKLHTGLGEAADDWPVPYWFVDGGAAVQTILLGAADLGLGALRFWLFDHEAAVRDRFGVPPSRRAVGTIALGHPAPDRPSRSAGRGRPPLGRVIHRGGW